jgi:hypothetical protein
MIPIASVNWLIPIGTPNLDEHQKLHFYSFLPQLFVLGAKFLHTVEELMEQSFEKGDFNIKHYLLVNRTRRTPNNIQVRFSSEVARYVKEELAGTDCCRVNFAGMALFRSPVQEAQTRGGEIASARV